MKLQTLAILSVLSVSLVHAKNSVPQKNVPQSINRQPGLDEIEAQSAALRREARKKDNEGKELNEKSLKLSKKSDHLEEKSKLLVEKANKMGALAEYDSQEAHKLAEQVENSEFKEQREEALKEICQKKIQKAKIFKIFDRRSEDQQIEKCLADYKESKLEKKEKIKRAYLGKQCTFNPGVSIVCPEGTYKFDGNDGLISENDDQREMIKEAIVGEQTAEVVDGSAATQK